MVVCLVFDIDDTIYENKTTQIIYDTIQQDYELYQLMKRIHLPKFVLTNAVYEHANIIINKLGIENLMRKVYARDNMNYMKEITTTKNGIVTVEIYRKNLSNGCWYRTCKSTQNEQDYNIEKKKTLQDLCLLICLGNNLLRD